MILHNCNAATNQKRQEMTRHGTALLPAACYEDDLDLHPVPWHWHDELEVAVVREGSVLVSAGAKQLTFSAGDGFFINAGVLHSACPAGEDGCKLHAVVFHPRLVGGSMDSVFWQRYLVPLMENKSLDLFPLHRESGEGMNAVKRIEGAWSAGETESIGYEFAMRSALSSLLLDVFTHCPAQSSALPEKDLRDNERMKLMLKYIQDNFSDEITIDEIAKSASISKSECLRCFKSIIKTTPIQYVKNYRLQRAAELLACTDLKISGIGAACGFQEMSYFSRAFRDVWGCLPSEYRACKRAKEKGL